MTASSEPQAWWSRFEIEPGSGMKWTLGSFELTLFRSSGEWLLVNERTTGEEVEPGVWRVTPIKELPRSHPSLVRYVADQTDGVVRLVARVGDRSVVARPRLPLHLLPGDKAKIYVSSPIWVEVTVGKRSKHLCELPVNRLSDTWFGSSTLEGEVAYALKTQARMNLASIPRRTYRIITPISIRNEGQDLLMIDRMNLPVPYLSVFKADDDSLWTEAITLVRNEGSQMALLEMGRGAPREVKGAKQLSEPRIVAEKNFLVRAFSSLLLPF